jgi:hypothetical protein
MITIPISIKYVNEKSRPIAIVNSFRLGREHHPNV